MADATLLSDEVLLFICFAPRNFCCLPPVVFIHTRTPRVSIESQFIWFFPKPLGNFFKQREQPSITEWPLNPQIFFVSGTAEEMLKMAAQNVKANLLGQDLKRTSFHKAFSSSTAGSKNWCLGSLSREGTMPTTMIFSHLKLSALNKTL